MAAASRACFHVPMDTAPARKRLVPTASVSPPEARPGLHPGLRAARPVLQPQKLRRGSPRIKWAEGQFTPHASGTSNWLQQVPAPSKRPSHPSGADESMKENGTPWTTDSVDPCSPAVPGPGGTPSMRRTILTPQTLHFSSFDSSSAERGQGRSPSEEKSATSLDSIQDALGVLKIDRGDSASPEVPPPRQRIRSVAPELGTVLEIRPEERSIDASAPRAGAHPQLQTLVETVASVDGSAPLPCRPSSLRTRACGAGVSLGSTG